jgi:hypothetical protein
VRAANAAPRRARACFRATAVAPARVSPAVTG